MSGFEFNQFVPRAGQATQATGGDEGWNFGMHNGQGQEHIMQQGILVSGQDGSISIVPIPLTMPPSLQAPYTINSQANPAILQGLSLRNQQVPTSSHVAQGNGQLLEILDLGSQGQIAQPGRANAVQGVQPSQLVLSYQGDCWVFDSVSPQKVESIISILNGQNQEAEKSKGPDPPQAPQVVVADSPRPNSQSIQRMISLNRFREKRKERNYEHKVRYSVRKEVAERMSRKNGQFAAKERFLSMNGGMDNTGMTGEMMGKAVANCVHCGTSKDSTPMMRKGPSGPQTLCNACGLMWANKGTLHRVRNPQRANNILGEQGHVHAEPSS